ncbi:MAG: Lrp/AsnC ligand binding domain-containing protein [Thaumarchaeota archaeon]|nr:Lrp/AsnC ligand binding domain-containing protein [Candidatus Calditenuaceae archaeon]MDW8041750.1 Lrp/AsnC ligand binding domain-containing protein [Nitrososphaerota archaeon]
MVGVKALVHLFVEPGRLEEVGEALSKFEEVTDVYEVTGEYDIVLIVTSNDVTSFRKFIAEKLLSIPGIRSAVSSIVLHIYKKGGKVTYE